MSMREAQEFLGVSALTMQRIVGRNRNMVIREAAPGVPSLLSGAEIRRLKRANTGLLTIKGVQRVLGIGRPVFLNLESMGLVRTVPETDFLLENRAYSRSAVESLLARCIHGAPTITPATVADLGLMSLEGASRSWRTIYDIVLALDGGRLRATGIDPGKRGLRSILLDPQRVSEALPHQEALSTSSELSKVLGVKAATLRVWRRAGFIVAENDRPIGGKDGVFYSPDAIRAFVATFTSSADLGRSEGKRPMAGLPIARDLITLGVRPVSGPGVDAAGTYLFRRPDLTADVLARVGAVRKKPDLQTQRELARSRVDLALQAVATMYGGKTSRRRNTLAVPKWGRVVHAVAGTRVSLVGRFTFHLEAETYAKLALEDDAWLALVPSEGPGFLLMSLKDIEWPRHVGPAAGKTKWLSMRLHPSVEERWAKYVVPLRTDGIKENGGGNADVRHTGFQDTAQTD
jgi:transposase-like protein